MRAMSRQVKTYTKSEHLIILMVLNVQCKKNFYFKYGLHINFVEERIPNVLSWVRTEEKYF